MRRRFATPGLLAALVMAFPAGRAPCVAGEASPAAAEIRAAMKRAAVYFRSKVARHGGYVYFTTLDLKERFGEGEASEDQIWVQPPGTPTVGMAYLEALDATGDPFYLQAATETAEALIYGQLQSGGWTNCIDFDPRGRRVALYRNGRGRGRNFSSLDDDQTQSAIRFLMRADRAHRFENEKIHEAATIALEALLRAQFNNGAFPQGWAGPVQRDKPVIRASFPDYDWRTEGRIKNYWDMYTLNDRLAGTVSRTLIEAEQIYGDPRFGNALTRLGDFLILAQLPDPQPAWSQQYNYQMHPIWARRFEPPAVAGVESEDAIEALLTIYQHSGEARFLQPVAPALEYMRKSLLPDGRLARYYELQTNRPLYMKRRGKVYSLTYDDSDLPGHYGWKSRPRLDRLQARYEELKQSRDKPEKRRRARDLARRVEGIIRSLDDRGRWVSTFDDERLVGDQRFRPGDRYISSRVFSDNVEFLSEYLQLLK